MRKGSLWSEYELLRSTTLDPRSTRGIVLSVEVEAVKDDIPNSYARQAPAHNAPRKLFTIGPHSVKVRFQPTPVYNAAMRMGFRPHSAIGVPACSK